MIPDKVVKKQLRRKPVMEVIEFLKDNHGLIIDDVELGEDMGYQEQVLGSSFLGAEVCNVPGRKVNLVDLSLGNCVIKEFIAVGQLGI